MEWHGGEDKRINLKLDQGGRQYMTWVMKEKFSRNRVFERQGKRGGQEAWWSCTVIQERLCSGSAWGISNSQDRRDFTGQSGVPAWMHGEGGKAELLSHFNRVSCEDVHPGDRADVRWLRATVGHLGCLPLRDPGKAKWFWTRAKSENMTQGDDLFKWKNIWCWYYPLVH